MQLRNISENKFFSCKGIRDIDKYTIENEPVLSIDLMERAAVVIYEKIIELYRDTDKTFIVFAGEGNNGGDAIALARILYDSGKNVSLYILKSSNKFKVDTLKNINRYRELTEVGIKEIIDISQMPILEENSIIVDGILGSGVSRSLEGFLAECVRNINNSGIDVISIDIPSGLFGEDNSENNLENIIKAKYTLSIEFPKLSFLFSEHEYLVGELHLLSINLNSKIISEKYTPYMLATQSYISSLIKPISKFIHKGDQGHALLVSGSLGMMGAAILGSRACLRTGVGLITTHIPACGYQIIQTSVPEAMVDIDNKDNYISNIDNLEKYDAIGVGPGIGTEDDTYKSLHDLIKGTKGPMVIDADAINILAKHRELIKDINVNSIITPHIGEFNRLVGVSNNSYERLKKQIQFAKENNIIVVLKGANTAIVTPTGQCFFNTTGNQGMATAGSGDVLTGIITSLLAQGYNPENSAKIGVFIHGLAGDFAAKKYGMRSLNSHDIIDFIPKAWEELINYIKFV